MDMIDTNSMIETPEGIELQLVTAGPVVRILAYAIDFLIRIAILIALFVIIGAFGDLGSGLMMILYFVLEWFYSVIFEMFNNGMTPGKKNMAIRVIHDDGTPLNWGSSILRNLLRSADFLPFMYISGLISMVINPQFKRLGDIVAATIVIYNPVPPTTAISGMQGSRPAPFPLKDQEQQAILAFAERSQRLSKPRQQELAIILADTFPPNIDLKAQKNGPPHQPNQRAVDEIKKIANGIIGNEPRSHS